MYLRITKERETNFIALAVRVKPQDWDADLGQVKKSYPNSKRVNNYILQRKVDA